MKFKKFHVGKLSPVVRMIKINSITQENVLSLLRRCKKHHFCNFLNDLLIFCYPCFGNTISIKEFFTSFEMKEPSVD